MTKSQTHSDRPLPFTSRACAEISAFPLNGADSCSTARLCEGGKEKNWTSLSGTTILSNYLHFLQFNDRQLMGKFKRMAVLAGHLNSSVPACGRNPPNEALSCQSSPMSRGSSSLLHNGPKSDFSPRTTSCRSTHLQGEDGSLSSFCLTRTGMSGPGRERVVPSP